MKSTPLEGTGLNHLNSVLISPQPACEIDDCAWKLGRLLLILRWAQGVVRFAKQAFTVLFRLRKATAKTIHFQALTPKKRRKELRGKKQKFHVCSARITIKYRFSPFQNYKSIMGADFDLFSRLSLSRQETVWAAPQKWWKQPCLCVCELSPFLRPYEKKKGNWGAPFHGNWTDCVAM